MGVGSHARVIARFTYWGRFAANGTGFDLFLRYSMIISQLWLIVAVLLCLYGLELGLRGDLAQKHFLGAIHTHTHTHTQSLAIIWLPFLLILLFCPFMFAPSCFLSAHIDGSDVGKETFFFRFFLLFYLCQCVSLVWSGLVWSGLVWSGLVWSGLVWSGLVWSGRVWSFCAT
ncbi:hypothetical protein B0T17DRAFT_400434 [Bombardia bombarda]|uniref:Uncharacterized protein n=1 Tax=Bombardia bombarda TaxID=252184 RepID=A0AA39W539_9PEZI|nr:hypothetical protein B0T17DRAFT_400434 [Bombardia bombarda]